MRKRRTLEKSRGSERERERKREKRRGTSMIINLANEKPWQQQETLNIALSSMSGSSLTDFND